MCSYFTQKMEKDQGDLADIVRASGGGGGVGSSSGAADVSNNHILDWEIPSDQLDFPSQHMDIFGDPFSTIQDPLLDDLDLADSGFFQSPKMKMEDDNNNSNSNSSHTSLTGNVLAQTILEDEMRRPSNIFSRMLQISPSPKMPISPHAISSSVIPSPRVGNDMLKITSSSVENAAVVQISSPRNTGIKRRKSQAKKVVCIPAPSAANSRPGGEVVPSDLWAWRKYGQKPIKGSPYPRGYYRCSSSKGCSARKQVERSRTDPNMLVITYTSEHNHPWPTQRNALAGSTRSQPTKLLKTSSSFGNPIEEDHKEKMSEPCSILSSRSIKEEMTTTTAIETVTDGEKLDQNKLSNQSDDFFADLGELDPDNLFTQGDRDHNNSSSKVLDPFSLFDWAENNTNSNNSFGEAKGRF